MRMNKAFLILAASAISLSVAGCSGLKKAAGLGPKKGPDEFSVVTRAPLEVPYGITLPVPQPGAPRPQELSPEDDARAVLLGDDTPTVEKTMTEEGYVIVGTPPEQPSDYTNDIQPLNQSIAPSEPQDILESTPSTSDDSDFLESLGTEDIDPSIRSTVDEEYKERANQEVPIGLKALRLGKGEFDAPADVVDPALERERINSNLESGQPVTEGETPSNVD